MSKVCHLVDCMDPDVWHVLYLDYAFKPCDTVNSCDECDFYFDKSMAKFRQWMVPKYRINPLKISCYIEGKDILMLFPSALKIFSPLDCSFDGDDYHIPGINNRLLEDGNKFSHLVLTRLIDGYLIAEYVYLGSVEWMPTCSHYVVIDDDFETFWHPVLNLLEYVQQYR